MTRFLYLVRHGEASPHDGPLSDLGREQARLVGQRLRDVPLAAIWHGPLPRAAQTAAIIAEGFPAVQVTACDLAGDYIPSDPDPAGLPAAYAQFVDRYTPAEREQGAAQAAAAIERFTHPGDAGRDTHELLVTHNFLIGCLVSHALDAPSWRWLGLNQMNAALTVIACDHQLPPRLISFNDAAHLPPRLRWTGFPDSAKPPSG
ncbi:MAG TPA: histidine phosphatase family protein [Streptosporangiaceae bacterium]|nr:histidine phosphatase family protein [Streptosporangiaceae bacterium]